MRARSAAVALAVACTVAAPTPTLSGVAAARAVAVVVSSSEHRDTTTATLRRGSTGIHVAHLQQVLASYGYTVTVDGIFGPQTERAVRHWQRSNGLTPDGIVGPTTWESVNSSPASTASRPAPSEPTPRGGAVDVEQVIRAAWPDDLEAEALRIAHRESALVPTARNSCCFGLFQIHFAAHRSWLASIGVTSPEQLLDADTNARAAYALYQIDGWSPWAL